MKRAIRATAVLSAAMAFTAATAKLEAAGRSDRPDRSTASALARAGVAWEPNAGQAADGVVAVGRGAGTTVLVEKTGAVVLVRGAAVRMTWTGAGGGDAAFGRRLRGVSHYLLGRDASAWRRGVAHHADVSIGGGGTQASVTWTSRCGRPAYDFHVPADVDATEIEIRFDGAAGELRLAPDGTLGVPVAGGTLRHGAPRAFEQTEDGPRPTPARWVLRGPGCAGFAVERTHAGRALVIDPDIDFATFLGGTYDDTPQGIAVRADGKVVVAGQTYSADFPAKGALQSSLRGSSDGFVTLFDVATREVVWSTYLGGSANDGVLAVATDGDDVLVGGATRSADFPVVHALGSTFNSSSAYFDDGFLARIAPDGASLAWSTYIGGTGADLVSSIAVAAGGSLRAAGRTTASAAFVSGATASAGASLNDATWVAALSGDGARRDWLFVLGPSSAPVVRLAIAPDGDCVVAGSGTFNSSNGGFPATAGSFGPSQVGDGSTQDAFVARVKSDGTGLRWAGLLGGGRVDAATGVAVDAAGNSFVAGSTMSDDFPVTAGAYQTKLGGAAGVYNPPYGYGDAFLTKIRADGSALVFSTYFGGSTVEICSGLAIDADGIGVLVGATWSRDFPVVHPPQYPPFTWVEAQTGDAFIARISADGARVLHSFAWGAAYYDTASTVALDGKRILLAGYSGSPGLARMGAPQQFPTAGGSAETIVARYDPSPGGDVDLTASMISADTARLHFTMSWDAAIHRVERRRGDGPWETAATLAPPTSSSYTDYDDVGLVAPNEYRYRLVASNDVGEAAPSNEARVETVPATPADLAASAVSSRRIDVSWTNPALQATSFEVSRSEGAGERIVVGTTAGTTFRDETLWPDRTYAYSVRAHSDFASSASSAPVAATTPPTLSVSVGRGTITLSRRARRDAVSLRGTLVALPSAAGEEATPLDFVHTGLVMRLGDRSGVKLLDALPDDARWRRKHGRIIWTNSGKSPPRTQFRFDPATGSFALRVRAVELALDATTPITIVADSALHSGGETAAWRPSRRGFVLRVDSSD